MFIARSKFTVSNGMEREVRDSFINRPHLVDDATGYIRMEVMNPVDKPEEFVLVTYWQDEASWKLWYRGHTYKAAHKGIPKGLKLIPKSAEISCYHLICE